MRSDHLIPSRRRSVRHGFTLIEVLGTLSILLALGVAAVSVLGEITEIGVRTNENRHGRVSVERLATTFREDVHRATESKLVDDGSVLTITTDDASIDYRLTQSPPVVLRRVVNAEKKIAYDRFPLPATCRPRFSEEGERLLVQLTEDNHRHPWIIEASRP